MPAVLMECAQQDKMLAVTSYMTLDQVSVISNVCALFREAHTTQCSKSQQPHSSHILWQLKLAGGYAQLYDNMACPWSRMSVKPLISLLYIRVLILNVWEHFHKEEARLLDGLRVYYSSGGVWSNAATDRATLMSLLVWYDMPSPSLLKLTQDCTSNTSLFYALY